MEEDHIILKVCNCKACEYRTTLQQAFMIHVDTPHESEKPNHVDHSHETNPDIPVNVVGESDNVSSGISGCILCPFCKSQSKNLDELKKRLHNSCQYVR